MLYLHGGKLQNKLTMSANELKQRKKGKSDVKSSGGGGKNGDDASANKASLMDNTRPYVVFHVNQ